MKTRNLFLLIGIVFLILSATEIQAQKKVVKKNSRKSAYQNKKPKIKVKTKHQTYHSNSFRSMPKGSIAINHKGVRFHYHGGKYFRQYAGRYRSVIPPIGIRIRTLPIGYVTFFMNHQAYHYHDGIYYTKRRNGPVYEVVKAPIGAVIHQLPMIAAVVEINGKPFFKYNSNVYKKIRSSKGYSYKVVGHLESYAYRY